MAIQPDSVYSKGDAIVHSEQGRHSVSYSGGGRVLSRPKGTVTRGKDPVTGAPFIRRGGPTIDVEAREK
jgi:hypothetical protein